MTSSKGNSATRIFYATQEIQLALAQDQLNRFRQLQETLDSIGKIFVYETPVRIVINDSRRS